MQSSQSRGANLSKLADFNRGRNVQIKPNLLVRRLRALGLVALTGVGIWASVSIATGSGKDGDATIPALSQPYRDYVTNANDTDLGIAEAAEIHTHADPRALSDAITAEMGTTVITPEEHVRLPANAAIGKLVIPKPPRQ